MTDNKKDIAILIPVYNDWECLEELLKLIKQHTPAELFSRFDFYIANDCSHEPAPATLSANYDLQVLSFVRNVGHQRAIAFSLGYLHKNHDYSYVLIMDSDGEDKPEHVSVILQAAFEKPGHVIFAKRVKRSEGPIFKTFYVFYKAVFRLMTGQQISFGNFSVLPAGAMKKAVHYSELLKHYSGCIIKSRSLYGTVELERGTRLAGVSKMNFINLILHGLSAISVYIEVVCTRVVTVSVFMAVSLGLVSVMIFFLKIATGYTSPGWATTVIIGCVVIIIQMLLLSMFITFLAISDRVAKQLTPFTDYQDFIEND